MTRLPEKLDHLTERDPFYAPHIEVRTTYYDADGTMRTGEDYRAKPEPEGNIWSAVNLCLAVEAIIGLAILAAIALWRAL